jgi:hypothetical protein
MSMGAVGCEVDDEVVYFSELVDSTVAMLSLLMISTSEH